MDCLMYVSIIDNNTPPLFFPETSDNIFYLLCFKKKSIEHFRVCYVWFLADWKKISTYEYISI